MSRLEERHVYHRDGNLKAKGHIKDDQLHGYWEGYCKDGTKLRSGRFETEPGPASGSRTARPASRTKSRE